MTANGDRAATPNTGTEATPTARTEDFDATLRETELHPYKWLKRGTIILFYFDQGKFSGAYQGPSRIERDARNDLCRVNWDDGTKWEVQLCKGRMFRGDDISKLNCGEWAVVGASETAGEFTHVAEAILDIKIFQREWVSIDGEDRRLFIPACAANATGSDGPFDVREAQRRDDWPKFSEAIESEIQNLKSHGTWVLVDESEAINQGAYIYPCRFVLVRKRNGRYNARWVLRGDHQIFDEPDLGDYDDDEDEEGNDNGEYEDKNEVTENGDEAEVASGDGTAEHGGAVEEIETDNSIGDAFNTAFAGLSQKVKNTYRQLFSPVLTTMPLMMIFATAIANDRSLFLADATGAFLLAPLLPEEVDYARPPKGYENHPEFKGKILRLVKSLCSLKQATGTTQVVRVHEKNFVGSRDDKFGM